MRYFKNIYVHADDGIEYYKVYPDDTFEWYYHNPGSKGKWDNRWNTDSTCTHFGKNTNNWQVIELTKQELFLEIL